MATKPQPAVPPADTHTPVSSAYARLVNRLRPQLWVYLSLLPAELRELYAANVAIQAVAVVLGCPMQNTSPYLDLALRPGTHLVAGEDRSREDRLATLAVNASAFYHMVRAGHQPEAVLTAIQDGLWMDLTFANAPDCASVFRHAKRRV